MMRRVIGRLATHGAPRKQSPALFLHPVSASSFSGKAEREAALQQKKDEAMAKLNKVRGSVQGMFDSVAEKDIAGYKPGQGGYLRQYLDAAKGTVEESEKKLFGFKKAKLIPSSFLAIEASTGKSTTVVEACQNNKVTMVSLVLSKFAVQTAQPWREYFEAQFGHKGGKVMEISVVPAYLGWGLFRSSILANICKQYEEGAARSAAFALFGLDKEHKKLFEVRNEVTAYIYLIDSRGKIRWKASGNPTQAHLDLVTEFSQSIIDTPYK